MMFELDDEERKKIEEINLKASLSKVRTDMERIEILRKAARKKGIIAYKLEDLKSETGEPFVESKSVNSYFILPKKIKMAVVSGKEDRPLSREVAYLCQSMYSKVLIEQLKLDRDPTACGWVKGIPKTEWYDNIGPLSGSSGLKYLCHICGKELEVVEFLKSLI